MVDRATRAYLVINTIDARGLYTPDMMGDIANPPNDGVRTAGYKSMYRVVAQSAQQDVLAELADGTGGTFYHNRNDVDEAMREAGAAPAVSYVLVFSPQNRSEEHTSELQSRLHLVCRLLLEKKKKTLTAELIHASPHTDHMSDHPI